MGKIAYTSSQSEAYAEELLDRLTALDLATVENYYDMGAIISALKHGKLYTMVGYDSFKELVGCELSFTESTASKYGRMYDNFTKFKYTKTEAIDLLSRFGLTNMHEELIKMTKKLGVRAIQRRIAAKDVEQICFSFTHEESEEIHTALRTFGARPSKNGKRWNDTSVAFLSIVRAAKASMSKAA